jgi:hypothetical protein
VKLDRLDIRASADVGGVITNRIRVKRSRKVAAPKSVTYRADTSVRGRDFNAAALGMCRSEFLRVAALGLAAFAKGKP